MSIVDDYGAIRQSIDEIKKQETPLKEVQDGVGLSSPTPYAMGPKGSLSCGSLEAAVNQAMERLKESMDASTPTATPTPTSYVRCYRWFLDRPNPALRMLPEVRKTSNRT